MDRIINIANYMNITGNSTIVNNGAPVGFKKLTKKITVSSVDYEFEVPNSMGNVDIKELVSQIIVTTENGTNQTCDFDWQGCMDPCASYTQINNSSGYSSSATSIVVDDGASIGSSTVSVPVMFAKFSTTGSPRRLLSYEWARVSSISTNTLTVARGLFGTTALALDDNDFVFYNLAWSPILDSGGSAIKLNDLATNGATAAVPVVGQLSMSSEGLTAFPYPFFRIQQSAPNDGGITYTAQLSAHIAG